MGWGEKGTLLNSLVDEVISGVMFPFDSSYVVALRGRPLGRRLNFRPSRARVCRVQVSPP